MPTFPKYESYKDSGVEWLGEIPSHWTVRRMKSFALVKRGASPRPISDPRYFDDHGEYGWVRIEDVTKSNKYLLETKQYLSSLGSSYSVKQVKGDLFLSIAGSVGKPIISQIKCCIHDGFVWFDWFNEINREFLFYIFLTGQPFIGLGKHGTQLNLNTATIGDVKLPFPTLEEQKRIVEFLDRTITEIDRAISQKQRLIELLQEQKAILINQAVTKGLNPNVPMRDSGIEWIGKIPEHWDFRRAKFLFSQSRLSVRKIDDVVTCYRDGEVTLRTNRRTEGYTFAILEQGYQGVRSGQLVINSMDAFAGAIGVSDSDGKCSPEYVVCDPVNPDLVEPKYYALLLREMALKGYIEVICPAVRQRGLRIRYNSFAQLLLPLPSKDEQRKIVEKVDAIIFGTAEALDSLDREIDLLKEMKSIVISQAVTGKIKV